MDMLIDMESSWRLTWNTEGLKMMSPFLGSNDHICCDMPALLLFVGTDHVSNIHLFQISGAEEITFLWGFFVRNALNSPKRLKTIPSIC
jgi:hypothetical protein